MTDKEKRGNDTFHIQADKSQINIAKDDAKITAQMNVSDAEAESFKEHIQQFIEWLEQQKNFSEEDIEETKELLETVNQQVESGNVKKTIVRQALAKLQEFQPLFIAGSDIGPIVSAITDVLQVFINNK